MSKHLCIHCVQVQGIIRVVSTAIKACRGGGLLIYFPFQSNVAIASVPSATQYRCDQSRFFFGIQQLLPSFFKYIYFIYYFLTCTVCCYSAVVLERAIRLCTDGHEMNVPPIDCAEILRWSHKSQLRGSETTINHFNHYLNEFC